MVRKALRNSAEQCRSHLSNCRHVSMSIFSDNGLCFTHRFRSYDKQGNLQQAMEWFNVLISVVPTDPGVLARMGDMFVRDGDKSQAFQYYSEVSPQNAENGPLTVR